ncbi:sensor histidine kinase [Paenibacillus albicereus]|uniref:Sensor histidine kinase n=1 Tax=Paenibacillus albicereus TaxID=2726185 RepID=A0A6H2GVB5_9BACL|nr:histidine kinase [Paenibacillus albicereus]QJC51106.1 sensor histidine kinase [Paenibacillus albicereus]
MRFSLNHVRLRKKMLIVYVVCVLVPIVLTNIVFYQVTTHNVRQQKLSDISAAMDQVRRDFLDQMDVAAGISSIFYTDARFNEAIERSYATSSDYVDAYYADIYPTMYRYSPIYKAIRDVAVYSANPTIVGGGGIRPITEEVEAASWYQALALGGGGGTPIVVRSVSQTSHGPETVFSFVRRLDYFGEKHGRYPILKIDIGYGAISALLRNATLQGDVYLVGGDGRILTAAGSAERQQELAAFRPEALAADAISVRKPIDNVDYLRGWSIEGAFPEHRVLQDVYKSRNLVVYLALPNVIVPTLVILWFTRSLSSRLARILHQMKRVRNHSFEPVAPPDYRDEIGQLTREFNRMTLQIKSLIDDVYLADILRKDLEIKRNQAQLHALQSQINPHFLFNALETIRMRSLIKKEEETAKIIHNMAKIFRRSLSWDRDWMTVREELELIHCFLEIQKYRFGDKLDYAVEADDEALEWLVPKMSVLPFVENASIHGIEKSKRGGSIRLLFRVEGSALVAEVADDGAGMEAEELEAIRGSLERDEPFGDHVGIQNVYRRLRLYYGERFELRMDSVRRKGTSVRIRLPRRGEEGPSDEPGGNS